jgi:excisionase family DNA binding protein
MIDANKKTSDTCQNCHVAVVELGEPYCWPCLKGRLAAMVVGEFTLEDSSPSISRVGPFHTPDEAAAIMRCHVSTVRRLIRKRKLGSIKHGGRVLISQHDISKYFQAHGRLRPSRKRWAS